MTGAAAVQRYLIALGSNRRHHRLGLPPSVIVTALAALDAAPLTLVSVSPTIVSRPLGPSARRYANAVAVIETTLSPPALLDRLKAIERQFGRRRARRWSARVLDLDIILWRGGAWQSSALTIPHPSFRHRRFVLGPARVIAPQWRDPESGLTVAHLAARLTRPIPARN